MGALLDPAVVGLEVELDARRLALGRVVPDRRDGRPGRRVLRVGHDDPEVGVVLRTFAAKPDLEHDVSVGRCAAASARATGEAAPCWGTIPSAGRACASPGTVSATGSLPVPRCPTRVRSACGASR